MGLFDKIAKVVKTAGDILDDGKLNNSFGSAEKTSATSKNYEKPQNKPTEKTAVNGKTTPPDVLASGSEPIGNMKIAEDFFYEGSDSNTEVTINFEIPETFTEFDSGADPESCHMYMADDDFSLNRPVFCITPEEYAYKAVLEFRSSGKVSRVNDFQLVNDQKGKALFKAKKTDYLGQTV